MPNFANNKFTINEVTGTISYTNNIIETIVTYTTTPQTLTISGQDNVICNSSSAMTINLPAVSIATGVKYRIKNINSGVVTIDANSSELIDGELTQTLDQWECIHIICNGTAWYIQ